MKIRYKWNYLRRVISPPLLARYGESFFECKLANLVHDIELPDRDPCFGDRTYEKAVASADAFQESSA
jgi:hypothetical protein